MSWLSKLTGSDARKRKQQLVEWDGAGPGKRYQDTTIDEGARAQSREGDYQDSRNRYLQALQGGQQAFETSARAAVSAAMPQFNSQLNGVRESAIRRGVQNGELGTSYEGDLASAFQKNITNSIAGQASNLYGQQLQGYGNMYGQDYGAEEDSSNRYADLLTGQLDRNEIARQRKNREQMGWANFGLKAIGAIATKGKGRVG